MRKLYILIGTRPNFIKVTQFKRVAETYKDMDVKIIHTGQHYDAAMADVFFSQFNLQPDYFLNIGQGTPNTQMATIMLKLEELFDQIGKPDMLVVPGDVNSTFAGALTANKMGIKLAHLESGLRSDDRTMPEEINRVLTDEISDLYFITEQSGIDNLTKEKKNGALHFVGNTMIDTLVAFESQIDKCSILEDLGVKNQPFVLMTIHRPSNVDSKPGLEKLIELIKALSSDYKIVFPIHPRTVANLEKYALKDELNHVVELITTPPMGYFEFQKLIKHSAFILTDSGGIQEESTYRQVSCLTLRENTERPITVTRGTNTLVPFDVEVITNLIGSINKGTYKKGAIPELWDGKATERIMDIINKEI